MYQVDPTSIQYFVLCENEGEFWMGAALDMRGHPSPVVDESYCSKGHRQGNMMVIGRFVVALVHIQKRCVQYYSIKLACRENEGVTALNRSCTTQFNGHPSLYV